MSILLRSFSIFRVNFSSPPSKPSHFKIQVTQALFYDILALSAGNAGNGDTMRTEDLKNISPIIFALFVLAIFSIIALLPVDEECEEDDQPTVDELEAIVENAIKNGHSIAWDGDVSEEGFSSNEGIAVLPVDESRKDLFINPGTELAVDQELRQTTFEN